MSHYMIATIKIIDREGYGQYEAGFMEIFQKYKGKLLAVDENVRLLEGEWPSTRTVLIEFPSEDDALAWYQSDEYQELAKHRFSSSDGNVVILQGMVTHSQAPI